MYLSTKVKENTLKKELNQILSVSKILEDYCGIHLTNGKGFCPFHQEEHGSFSVSKDDSMFRCFSGGCNRGGRAIDLLYMLNKEGLITSPPELVRRFNSYGEFLLMASRYYKTFTQYKHMLPEFTDENIVEKLKSILTRKEVIPKVSPLSELPLKMRFKQIRRNYVSGKLTDEQLVDIFWKLQHESVDNPQNMDELYTSAFNKATSISLDDIMGD